jgi:HEPN domain-containing protein
MSDIKAAQQLIARSVVDLVALEELVDNHKVVDEIYGFLAQQAVEKALKARLALLGFQFPITHNLTHLVSMLEDVGVKVEESGKLSFLTPFAVQYRYEGPDFDDSLDRKSILRKVRAIVSGVRKLVEEDAGGGLVKEERAVYKVRKTTTRKTTTKPKKPRRKV